MAAPIVIISGPSGIGKSTVIARLISACHHPLRLSVSETTRAPRAGEVEGVHYHFVSREGFERDVAEGRFLEWAVVHERDFYGTPIDQVEPFLRKGVGVILEIDVQGAAQVRKHYPQAFSVFLTAPAGIYEARLRARGTESEEAIARRLRTATLENARIGEYTVAMMNDVLETTVERIKAAVEPLFHTP